MCPDKAQLDEAVTSSYRTCIRLPAATNLRVAKELYFNVLHSNPWLNDRPVGNAGTWMCPILWGTQELYVSRD